MNALEAMTLEHRAEVGKLAMQLALYRAELERHGIEPPDQTGEELLRLWRSSAAVVSTAGRAGRRARPRQRDAVSHEDRGGMSLREYGIRRADALAVAILFLLADQPWEAERIYQQVRWSK